MTDFKSTITKLNGTNNAAWSQKMEVLLIRDEVWDAVSKETSTPPDPAWIKKDNQARTAINLCMGDDQLLHIQGTSSSPEVWLKLKSHHQRSTTASTMHLYIRLFNMKMANDGNVETHITEMLTTISKLAAMGEELKENLQAALLI